VIASIADVRSGCYDQHHNDEHSPRQASPTGFAYPSSPYDLRHTAAVEKAYTVSNKTFKEVVMITEKKKVTKDTIIGDVIKNVPGGRAIIEKYFGNGCFTCPGINMESLSFGSMMHNLDPDKIVDEINKLEG
jgi:hypothetical protein